MSTWLKADCQSVNHPLSPWNVTSECCEHQVWTACLTRGEEKALRTRTCIQIKDNFAVLSVVCLTACLCLLCRWRWMQTISAIAHAPKVSARIHTHTHSGNAIQGDLHSPSTHTHVYTQARTYTVHTPLHKSQTVTVELPFLTALSLSLARSLFLYILQKQNHKVYILGVLFRMKSLLQWHLILQNYTYCKVRTNYGT